MKIEKKATHALREGIEIPREDKWEKKLAVPVLMAALVSVPAVFLTLMSDPYHSIGKIGNLLSGVVLISETVVLLAVSESKIQWARKNIWLILLTIAVLFAVIFAVGPIQLLRLVRVFGTLRIVRAGRIVKAIRLVNENSGFNAIWARVISFVLGGAVVVFVIVVLSDPTSMVRSVVDDKLNPVVSIILVCVAAAILAGATFIVMKNKQSKTRR